MSFLNAEWRKLAIANYPIDPNRLSKYVPKGTELDLWKGKCYVSLVGFMFKNTKLLSVKIPFHTNFEEVNLRFYVKRFENNTWKRGVVFIKEIVPKPALTFVANSIYKEHYVTLPMRHQWKENEKNRVVEYSWKKNKKWHSIKVVADLESSKIAEHSVTEFITEHYWGYAKVNNSITNEYEVTHPKWRQYKVEDFVIDVDFGINYGKGFECLNNMSPETVMLAEGSEITVENKKTIK
ncbi:YqjF family protein [Lacinutrix chionoecetis]